MQRMCIFTISSINAATALANASRKEVGHGHRAIPDINERIHYGDLKDRFRQRRDRTRQLITQLSTLNTRNNLNPTVVRLLGKTLSKENIRKYSKFETLATTICDQQGAL